MMRLEVTAHTETIELHVTDDTGRDDTVTIPRYPRPGSELYVKLVDTLDLIMYKDENEKGSGS